MLDLFLADTRQSEFIVGAFLSVLGLALLASALEGGWSVATAGALLAAGGAFQARGALRWRSDRRRYSNAVAMGACAWALARAVHLEALVPVVAYGFLSGVCWLLWMRATFDLHGS